MSCRRGIPRQELVGGVEPLVVGAAHRIVEVISQCGVQILPDRPPCVLETGAVQAEEVDGAPKPGGAHAEAVAVGDRTQSTFVVDVEHGGVFRQILRSIRLNAGHAVHRVNVALEGAAAPVGGGRRVACPIEIRQRIPVRPSKAAKLQVADPESPERCARRVERLRAPVLDLSGMRINARDEVNLAERAQAALATIERGAQFLVGVPFLLAKLPPAGGVAVARYLARRGGCAGSGELCFTCVPPLLSRKPPSLEVERAQHRVVGRLLPER